MLFVSPLPDQHMFAACRGLHIYTFQFSFFFRDHRGKGCATAKFRKNKGRAGEGREDLLTEQSQCKYVCVTHCATSFLLSPYSLFFCYPLYSPAFTELLRAGIKALTTPGPAPPFSLSFHSFEFSKGGTLLSSFFSLPAHYSTFGGSDAQRGTEPAGGSWGAQREKKKSRPTSHPPNLPACLPKFFIHTC